jgi:hypothetical protein
VVEMETCEAPHSAPVRWVEKHGLLRMQSIGALDHAGGIAPAVP